MHAWLFSNKINAFMNFLEFKLWELGQLVRVGVGIGNHVNCFICNFLKFTQSSSFKSKKVQNSFGKL
jgi:hypothetical protein